MVPSTLGELDFIQYALGFDGIEAGIHSQGQWVLNLRRKCRHLLPNFRCELHGTPEKPLVCRSYDEHKCLYRSAFLGDTKAEYLRLDIRRFRALRSLVRFDSEGRVASVPDRDTLFSAILQADAEADITPAWPPPEPPRKRLLGNVRWNAAAGYPEARLPEGTDSLSTWQEAAESPCQRCATPCCQVIIFEFGNPTTLSSVDFMEYMLGFEGVELALTPSGWKTLVNSTCRYFDGELLLCKLFGQPERPLICSSYDAYKCAYRSWLMEPQRTPFIRVDHDAFQIVRRHLPLNAQGEVITGLSVDQLRTILDVTVPNRRRVAPSQHREVE
jgi:hypothetical protein